MRLTAVICGILFATAALACPNLSGNYRCTDDGEVWDQVVTQEVNENGHTVYMFHSDGDQSAIIADNIKYEEKDGNGGYYWQQSACNNERLETKFEAMDSGTGVLIGGTLTMMLDQTANFVEHIGGYYDIGNGRQPIETQLVCVRQ